MYQYYTAPIAITPLSVLTKLPALLAFQATALTALRALDVSNDARDKAEKAMAEYAVYRKALDGLHHIPGAESWKTIQLDRSSDLRAALVNEANIQAYFTMFGLVHTAEAPAPTPAPTPTPAG